MEKPVAFRLGSIQVRLVGIAATNKEIIRRRWGQSVGN